MEKVQKLPGPDHPITVELFGPRVTVRVGERTIANSDSALVLKESTYPEVFYIPREDVDQSVLIGSDTTSYCPYKGDCRYFTISGPDGVIEDAAWSYETPFESVEQIAGHLAFYPTKVEVTTEDAA